MAKFRFPEKYRNKKVIIRMAAGCAAAVLLTLASGMAVAFTPYTNSFNAEYGTDGTNGGSTLGSCITFPASVT